MDNETKMKLQRTAYARMTLIEERYFDNVPEHAQAYWRLNYLIAEGMRAYVGSYGQLPIHLGDAADGREELSLGPLSGFERDAIKFLNDVINESERRDEQRLRLPPVRQIGFAG